MFYEIPDTLPDEIEELAGFIAAHRAGALDGEALKARRVPFGCYEQRRDGTFMARIRTTGGAITPDQLRCLAELSAAHRGHDVHITTRQEFQIHDLTLEEVVPVMRALLDCGLATRGGGGNTVRNILVSPDAGVAPDEVFDPSPYAFALTTRLVAEGDSWMLPRKLKIAFSNGPADSAYAQFNDVGFVARLQGGRPGFRVYVAGGMGTKPEVAHLLHDFIPAEEAYIVSNAVKRLFDKHGNRKNRTAARLRFLWRTLGEERFRELYEAERQALLAAPGNLLTPAAIAAPAATIPAAAAAVADPAFALWKTRFARAQRQPGLYSVVVPVFLGNLANPAARAIADLARDFGPDSLRASFQNLLLRHVPEAALGRVWQVMAAAGLAGQAPILANAVSCTGADTCKLGICLSKGALTAVVSRLEKSDIALDAAGDFHLNLSGCPNTCGQHMLGDLGFFGNARQEGQRLYPAYAVVAGARRAEGEARFAQAIDRVAAHDLPQFVEAVVRIWLAKKDRFASFADYIDGEGTADLKAIAESLRPIPDYSVNRNYYFDWGAAEVFSLVGRGQGECAAGLFDLIGIELKAANRDRETLLAATGAASNDQRGEAAWGVALHAARALLVTRGVEAAGDAAAFEQFRRHFVEAGLIDRRFLPLLALGRTGDRQAIAAQPDEALALLAAVEALYESMDNSLRFPEKPPVTVQPNGALQERDYRGVACPLNFAKVKLDLERLAVGDGLKVLLDDGEPIRNVPRSVAQEGHRVLSQTRQGDAWEVLIEKTHV